MRTLAMVEWDWSLSTTNGFIQLIQNYSAKRFYNLAEGEQLLRHPVKSASSKFMQFLTDLGMIVQSLKADLSNPRHPGAREAVHGHIDGGTIWAPDDAAVLAMFEVWYNDGGFNAEGLGHVWDPDFMDTKVAESFSERRGTETSPNARPNHVGPDALRKAIDGRSPSEDESDGSKSLKETARATVNEDSRAAQDGPSLDDLRKRYANTIGKMWPTRPMLQEQINMKLAELQGQDARAAQLDARHVDEKLRHDSSSGVQGGGQPGPPGPPLVGPTEAQIANQRPQLTRVLQYEQHLLPKVDWTTEEKLHEAFLDRVAGDGVPTGVHKGDSFRTAYGCLPAYRAASALWRDAGGGGDVPVYKLHTSNPGGKGPGKPEHFVGDWSYNNVREAHRLSGFYHINTGQMLEEHQWDSLVAASESATAKEAGGKGYETKRGMTPGCDPKGKRCYESDRSMPYRQDGGVTPTGVKGSKGTFEANPGDTDEVKQMRTVIDQLKVQLSQQSSGYGSSSNGKNWTASWMAPCSPDGPGGYAPMMDNPGGFAPTPNVPSGQTSQGCNQVPGANMATNVSNPQTQPGYGQVPGASLASNIQTWTSGRQLQPAQPMQENANFTTS